MDNATLIRKINEYAEKIHYSDKYEDDEFEYRHVILPKPLLKILPKQLWNEESGCLRLLAENEWRGIGVQQSLGWVHYEVHAPEPHVLLFRRPLNYAPPQQAPPPQQNGSRSGKERRK
ncbi:hypothetical protein PLICRDRAFT_175764 [Plicaturopsis crispa FD-325 SS-3]|nr:hypothetical protein PLICRDRAFT_175764 [Plicaturopsis crispa FD-325 SS-3]